MSVRKLVERSSWTGSAPPSTDRPAARNINGTVTRFAPRYLASLRRSSPSRMEPSRQTSAVMRSLWNSATTLVLPQRSLRRRYGTCRLAGCCAGTDEELNVGDLRLNAHDVERHRTRARPHVGTCDDDVPVARQVLAQVGVLERGRAEARGVDDDREVAGGGCGVCERTSRLDSFGVVLVSKLTLRCAL